MNFELVFGMELFAVTKFSNFLQIAEVNTKKKQLLTLID